jgi:predicted MFS family arabinose efflux permease
LAIAVLAVWGIAFGAMPVALQMWMAQATPDIREGGMAQFVANFQISIALGSFGGGPIVDRFGLLDAMHAGAALAALSMLTITLFGRAARAATGAGGGGKP